MTQEQIAELVNLYHTARTALAGQECGRWARMMWAVRWFCAEHPDFSTNQAYKALDRALS